MDIQELLTISLQQQASDLHLSVGLPPMLRMDGELQPLAAYPALTSETLQQVLQGLMSESQRQHFANTWEADFAWKFPNANSRFRVNIFQHERGLAGVLRVIPESVKNLAELNLPKILQDFTALPHGLVLITGPTGSGKTTTLAAMIDHINQHQAQHIITIEDPVEFLHFNKRSLIHQREVQRDTKSFNTALRSVLREDPDVILIGELRDLETIRLALTAAETGHLVFATLHTTSAAKTINRLIDVFPGDEKNTVRSLLSETLQAVVCQSLVKKITRGRVAALEIMICNAAIRNLIREDKIAQMYSTIQTSAGSGMQTLDQHLKILVTNGVITNASAKKIAVYKDNF